MLPFSTSFLNILNETQKDSKLFQNAHSKFILEKRDDCNDIVQHADTSLKSSSTSCDQLRRSCSNLPISSRQDRFQEQHEYSKMYSYNGLTDTRHYLSIKRILKTINQWDFNIFALERFSSGYPLTYLALNLFEVHDLINYFELDISKMYQFITTIERSYHASNPYHNALHAADVTQAINCIIVDKKIWSQLSKKDVLCSLLSTICHDVDHPGFNNAFMINSEHHLSLLYKKESVLENHHWGFSLSVLLETKLFSHFDIVLWKSVTETCGSLIRATDISKQSTYIDDFNKSLLPVVHSGIKKLNSEEKLLVLQMAIKCADICNPCRKWDISNCWAHLVTEEFFQQGDKEAIMSLPVSPIMDREKTKLAIVQKDFINYLVQPLFRVWHQFIGSDLSRMFLKRIESNLAMWQILSNQPALDSMQSLYDRVQLMQMMDYTKNHQLFHLQRLRLLIDSNYLGEEEEEECLPRQTSAELNGNQIPESPTLYKQTDKIDEGQMKFYNQCRRGSLPITLLSNTRDTFSGNNSRKTAASNRQKLMVRRTSLQPGQGFTTSFTSTFEAPKFPTACRRKSAPAIKINTACMFDTISSGRRGSLASYFCPNTLCSSQSQLHKYPINSMKDIRIPQVG